MVKILNIIGIVLIFLSLAYSGSMSSGDRIRNNYTNESTEERSLRYKISFILLMIGLSLLGVNYFFSK